MTDLGLNSHHEEEVRKYLKFARYNRKQQLRSVEGCFKDLKDSRLNEDTYTLDEVEEIITDLQTVVRSSVESELLNDAHTNVLLLVQLFSQAEKWHLKLQADISELENQKLLKEVADFELNENSISKTKAPLEISSLAQKTKLQPLNEGTTNPLLQMEIERLKNTNEELRNKFAQLEKSATVNSKESAQLRTDLEQAKQTMNEKKPGEDNSETMVLLSEKVSSLSMELVGAEEKYKTKFSSLEEEVSSSKHYILALQHEVEVLTAESEKKFSESSQFKNLKKMLEQKNGQLKELRKKLKQYEPDAEAL